MIALQGMFAFFLVCTGATNCPNIPIYDNDVYFSLATCNENGEKIARSMHYKQGGEWAWKCFPADYQPKELP